MTSFRAHVDGLATDVRLPDGPGPFPAVLVRTPYDRTRHRAEARGWARRGFAAVVQDVRGRFASAGEWHPYANETADGAATARWIRRQPWNDGRYVAVGSSYGAHCALVLALEADREARPDAVLAAVPALGAAETAREPSGAERLLSRAGWWAAHGDRRDSDEGALGAALAADPGLLAHLPLTALPDRLGRSLPSWAGLWRHHERGRLTARAANACVPLLAVGGHHDHFAEDTAALWRAWGGPSARLLLGPWGHGLTSLPGPDAGPAHRVNLGDLYARWAHRALTGALAPGRRGALALGGGDLWLPAATEGEPRTYGRRGAGDEARARGRRRGGGEPRAYGRRGTGGEPRAYGRRRAGGEPRAYRLRLLRGSVFTADPDRPVRSDDLAVPVGGEPDRCVLATSPLPRPLDAVGPVRVGLRAAADTPSADWTARLVALAPEGTAERLAVGVLRRERRTDPADPADRAEEFTIDLGRIARRLRAGVRLRLEIAGHHFPAHARNPHTGDDPVTARRLLPSRREVDPGGVTLTLHVLASRPTTPTDPFQEIPR
ncbi:CocE/NonD family hydrolase [Streptomyces sp. NPDC013012]|uniref:CocE/NonD family hydrolase n=1 Tax=Streptomyces sp. NPDC013012 TaxID=3364860 RepID=UPI0036C1D56A